MRSLLRYLKPNFSWHWGNWLLAPILAFMLGFLPLKAFSAEVGDPCSYLGLYQSWHVAADTYREACESVQREGYTYQIDSTGTCRSLEKKSNGTALSTLWPNNSTWGTPDKCPMPLEPECPASGTPFNGIPNTGGDIGSYGTDENGCAVVPVYGWLSPAECNDGTGMACQHITGYEYGDTPPELPPEPCYDDSGTLTGTAGGGASCPPPGGTTDPTDPTDPGDTGGDGGDTGGGTGDGGTGDGSDGSDGSDGGDGSDGSDGSDGGTTGGGAGDGSGSGEGEGDGACDDESMKDTIMCEKLVPNNDEPEGFDSATTKIDADIQTAWADLDSVISDTRGEIEQYFQLHVSSGGGALPCFPFIEWNGVSQQICLSEYKDELGKMAAAILFLCIVIALFVAVEHRP